MGARANGTGRRENAVDETRAHRATLASPRRYDRAARRALNFV
jgi:hypothetical protein